MPRFCLGVLLRQIPILAVVFWSVFSVAEPGLREEALQYASLPFELGGLNLQSPEADQFARRVSGLRDGHDYLVRHRAIFSYARLNLDHAAAVDYSDRIARALKGRQALSEAEMKAALVVTEKELPEFMALLSRADFTLEQKRSAIRVTPIAERQPNLTAALDWFVDPAIPGSLRAEILEIANRFNSLRGDLTRREVRKTKRQLMEGLDGLNTHVAKATGELKDKLGMLPVVLADIILDTSDARYMARVKDVIDARHAKYNNFWNGVVGTLKVGVHPIAALSTLVFGTATIWGAAHNIDVGNVAAMWGLTSLPWYLANHDMLADHYKYHFEDFYKKQAAALLLAKTYHARCETNFVDVSGS